jgi:hypothetical protein
MTSFPDVPLMVSLLSVPTMVASKPLHVAAGGGGGGGGVGDGGGDVGTVVSSVAVFQ